MDSQRGDSEYGDRPADPLSDEEFAVLLERLGPFERRPKVAVAVSGGADSMALALLTDRWAKARGGRALALTVDHRLRPESADEAAQVHDWLTARGVTQHILVWQGPYPDHDRQAAARAARYRLLEAWCEAAGCLHLLMAHHREDQAETFWLRLTRGSGAEGLAAMSAVSERAACRILRPLLAVPPDRLAARLHAEGQAWIEDPSNRNTAYARVRFRQARETLAREGLGADRLGATIGHLGRARGALEAQEARLLARAVRLHPAGYAWLEISLLTAARPEIGLRALAAVLAAVGGTEYPPRLDRLERLYSDLASRIPSPGKTLGGCGILPRREGLLIYRELAATAPPVDATSDSLIVWDGRFRIVLPRDVPKGLWIAALGDGQALPPGARSAIEVVPAPARPSLPALRDARSLAALPSLGWVRSGLEDALSAVTVRFRPRRGLAPLGFTVV